MKKIVKRVFGAILLAGGLSLSGLSVYLFFHSTSPVPLQGLVGMFLFGLLVGFGGFSIVTGESIREIIELLLLGS